MFRHEIWLFTNEYNKFKDTVITLGNDYDNHHEEVENTYGDCMIIYEYLIAVRNPDFIFQEIFNRIQQLHKGTEERQAKFKGISKAIKDYIKSTSDDYLASLILDRQITTDNSPQWFVPRNEPLAWCQKNTPSDIFNYENENCYYRDSHLIPSI